MPSPTVYFTGWEDFNFSPIGDAGTTTGAGNFRAGWARAALYCPNDIGTLGWYRIDSIWGIAVSSPSWFTFRWGWGGAGAFKPGTIFSFNSADDVQRIGIQYSGGAYGFGYLFKADAAGHKTSLADFTAIIPGTSPEGPAKIDMFLDYSASGAFACYGNGQPICAFSGDLTTDGVTTLQGADLGGPNSLFSGAYSAWFSEVIWADSDTRSWGLAMQAPNRVGNADTWTGGLTDINEIVLNDGTFIYTGTDDQIEEFGVNMLPPGNWQVIANTVAMRPLVGFTGPQNVATVTRSHSIDSAATPVHPNNSFTEGIETIMPINPATGNPWLPSELNDPGYNIGVESFV
jgi:hypothetical protein